MKAILLLVTIFITNILSQDASTKNYSLSSTGFGRASDISIIGKNYKKKQSTCCTAAEMDAISYSSSIQSTVSVRGKLKKSNILFESSGIVKPTKTECISTLNDYEECKTTITFDSTTKTVGSVKRGNGWEDDDTYHIESKGRASRKAIDKSSYAMKETTCIESSKLNAIGNMIADVAKENNRNTENLNIKMKSPQIWINSCQSLENDFETCVCDILLVEKNLKQKVLSEL